MNVIDLRPLFDGVVFPILTAFLVPLAGAVASWAVYKIGVAAHFQVTAGQAAIVGTAMQNAAALVISKGEAVADANGKITVAQPALAEAANYVIARVPNALQVAGINPANVAGSIEARVAAQLLPAPPAAPAAPAPLQPPA